MLAACVAGCQLPPDPSAAAPKRPIPPPDDPCAWRMQDIEGALLHYYHLKRQLPPRLEDLAILEDETVPPLVCPVSGEPYVYHPDGVAIPGSDRRVIVYDAKPVHSNMRWAIIIDVPQPAKPLVADVVLMVVTTPP